MFAAFAGLAGTAIAGGMNSRAQKKALKLQAEATKTAAEKTRQMLIAAGAFAVLCVTIAVVKRGR